MRKLLIAITAAIMAIALSMGGSAGATGCIGGSSDAQPDYDNSVEKAAKVDIDISKSDIRRGQLKICGLPDGGD